MQEITGIVGGQTLVAFRSFSKDEIPVEKGSQCELVVRQCKLLYIGAEDK